MRKNVVQLSSLACLYWHVLLSLFQSTREKRLWPRKIALNFILSLGECWTRKSDLLIGATLSHGQPNCYLKANTDVEWRCFEVDIFEDFFFFFHGTMMGKLLKGIFYFFKYFFLGTTMKTFPKEKQTSFGTDILAFHFVVCCITLGFRKGVPLVSVWLGTVTQEHILVCMLWATVTHDW